MKMKEVKVPLQGLQKDHRKQNRVDAPARRPAKCQDRDVKVYKRQCEKMWKRKWSLSEQQRVFFLLLLRKRKSFLWKSQKTEKEKVSRRWKRKENPHLLSKQKNCLQLAKKKIRKNLFSCVRSEGRDGPKKSSHGRQGSWMDCSLAQLLQIWATQKKGEPKSKRQKWKTGENGWMKSSGQLKWFENGKCQGLNPKNGPAQISVAPLQDVWKGVASTEHEKNEKLAFLWQSCELSWNRKFGVNSESWAGKPKHCLNVIRALEMRSFNRLLFQGEKSVKAEANDLKRQKRRPRPRKNRKKKKCPKTQYAPKKEKEKENVKKKEKENERKWKKPMKDHERKWKKMKENERKWKKMKENERKWKK